MKTIIFGILIHVVTKMKNMITSEEIVDIEAKPNGEVTKTLRANFNKKKITYKPQNLYSSLTFILTTTALLIAISIYCYLIKYWAKRKYLLTFHSANNELRKLIYW